MILGKLFPGLGWGRRRRSAIPVPSASRGSLAVENKVRCSPEPSPPSYAPPPSEVGKLRAGPSEQGTPRLLLLSGSFPSLFSSTTSRKTFQYLLKKLKVTSPQSDFNVNLSSVLYYSECLSPGFCSMALQLYTAPGFLEVALKKSLIHRQLANAYAQKFRFRK